MNETDIDDFLDAFPDGDDEAPGKAALVTGSRASKDAVSVFRVLDRVRPDLLIVGDAEGIDAHARFWAELRGAECEVFKADWNKHGRRAGPIRNEAMARRLGAVRLAGGYDVVALGFLQEGRENRGTRNCLGHVRALRPFVPSRVFRVNR